MDFPFDFKEFASRLKSEENFEDSSDCTEFLKAFLDFAVNDKNIVSVMPSCGIGAPVPLYRVVKDVTQNKDGTYNSAPFQRVMPNGQYTSHGRANYPGDAFLYLASEVKTALQECRTQENDKVTLSEFSVKETFSVMHLGQQLEFYRDLGIDLSAPSQLNYRTWDQINKAFSEPRPECVLPEDFYKPMQLIANKCADKNIHGLFFESSVSQGTNCVLFDFSGVELKCSKPIIVKSVSSFDYTDLPLHT